MTDANKAQFRALVWICIALVIPAVLAGCGDKEPKSVQGYVEGEFVYIASPYAGQLERLYVRRGQQVKKGDLLFDLDNAPEKAARDQAERTLAQARSTLEDLKKPRRPTEIESIDAQLRQARAALVFSEKEYERQKSLAQTGARSVQDFDRARATRDQDQQRVAQLEADLETARLGSRADQIRAQEDNVRSLEATLVRAEWDLAQKSQPAPKAGLVYDTLYRQGEWVAAGRPVVSLLPPENIKIRVFVPEPRIATIKYGDRVRVTIDGVQQSFEGKVSYISPQAEFTPPVIYSRESRAKLVFMVEADFDPAVSAELRPGQPVDAVFGSES